MKYQKLFEPGSIGGITLRNRIVMSPMQTHFTQGGDNRYTERYIEYYCQRARGGAGLIITNHVKAEKKIDPYPITYGYPTLDSLNEIKYFHELTESVHRYGAKIAIELSAGTGRLADVILPDKWPIGPSEISLLSMPELRTRALTRGEIAGLVEAYGKAAGLARQAGFDILYVHATAYLIDQFLSSCWNRREDEYGGPLENRMRFLLECIASAREQVGKDFPIIVGLALDHGFLGGRELNESIEIAGKLKEIGVDTLHLRRGSYDSMNLIIPTDYMEDGVSVPYAEILKRETGLKTIVDGNLSDPDLEERLILENKLDFVGMGRPLFADPWWPEKARRGREEEILPCIRCMQCINRVFFGQYAACSVNPFTGKEYLGPLAPVKKAKRILIAGGGPAGMYAAVLASERGHRVTLIEKGDRLGGHLRGASVPAHKKEVYGFYKWLLKRVENSDIELKLGTEVTPELVRQLKPDAVIVATGSVPSLPQVPGMDKPLVRIATELLSNRESAGERVVIVGAGLVGCETALYLAGQGRKVTLIDMLPEIAADVVFMARFSLLAALQEKGIQMEAGLRLKEISDEGIVVEDDSGRLKSIASDTVVIATGLKPNSKLYDELAGEVQEIYQIGDCREPRNFLEAVHEAYYIVKEI